ncbi:MAG: phosphoribosylformylglycinamidine synthase subunit PurL [Elusimicrobia bacterium]|nr:phosphoribosylformylglycinamidine synthase subunit PurL [Elusimicrobiota bacterium]
MKETQQTLVMSQPAVPPREAEGSDFASFNSLSPKELKSLSDKQLWSLNESELSAVQAHFKSIGRPPTRAEIETIAQTWSEHCKHKTFRSPIRYTEGKKTRLIKSLFEETIAKATKQAMKPWCLSVFKDNAGIVSFGKNGRWALAYKVETHNHPCAIEPYGGAETGVGGVIRDVLGAGLGAKPVLNTDIFCFARPDYDAPLPENALHPKRVLRSVVAGVRDYGNRMGIPTAAGAIWFDDDFRLNPLVFVGTVGVMPSWAVKKEIRPGDLIVAVGGPTGRDGLHGATFSSASLEDAPTSAVQIGHAINEKKLLDALLEARDRRLYGFATDCGAGGFSSAIGEMAAVCGGAEVKLDAAHIKALDLAPWELWLSESQERMVLAVSPKNLKALKDVFAAESCGLSVLGEFTNSRKLRVHYKDQKIVELDLKFLHHGVPLVERSAVWQPETPKASSSKAPRKSASEVLREALGHLNVCSREWVIRQYDHEVQGGMVIKPLQGVRHDGPGDACVIWPHAATGDFEDFSGFAVGHGINPSYGKVDPYRMALACADEALRNLLCVGADVTAAAFLDNFCWASPEDPRQLGALVRAAQGCHDAAVGFGVPFISGKDSLYNQSKDLGGKDLPIPGTVLISALAPLSDVRKALTMDIKGPGNPLYLIGWTSEELGGSLYNQICGLSGGEAPEVEVRSAADSFKAASAAIQKGLVLSAHDLSEGGLAVAAAEMAFSGEFGVRLDLDAMARSNHIYSNEVLLFSESPSRVLLEVKPECEQALLKGLKGVPVRRIGVTLANPILKVIGLDGMVTMEEPLSALKEIWQASLPKRCR